MALNHESMLGLITEHETTTAAQIAQLREQISTLTDNLATLETELLDLATTRTTLLRLAGTTHSPTTTDTTVASLAYQQILAVFATTSNGLRAKDICHALGTGTTGNDIAKLRAKLKRLAARGVLTEPAPGLFILATPAATSFNPDSTA